MALFADSGAQNQSLGFLVPPRVVHAAKRPDFALGRRFAGALHQLVFGVAEEGPAYKRLIITHHKDLNVGDFLIDDQPAHGASEFAGEWLHFGEGRPYPDWPSVVAYLRGRAT